MQKMGAMPGGPGPMDATQGGMMPGGPMVGEAGRSIDQATPGGAGPMDPPLGQPMGSTMGERVRHDEGFHAGEDEPAGLLPSPRSDSERFFEDLKLFVTDTEQLLRQARTLSGEGAIAARAEFERRLAQARDGFDSAREVAVERMNDWRDRTEAYVRRDPWKAVGIAAGVGFLLAMLTGRGGDDE